MKTLKKSKTKIENKVIENLKVFELLKIKGGKEQTRGLGTPTTKDCDID